MNQTVFLHGYCFIFLFVVIPRCIEGNPLHALNKESIGWSVRNTWEQLLKFIEFCDEYEVLNDEESDCHHYLMCGADNKWHKEVCPGNWGFSLYYNTCVPYIQSECSPTVVQDYYEDWYLEEDNIFKWSSLAQLWETLTSKSY